MVVSGLTWYYLILSTVGAIANVVIFLILMFNFFKKRTVGTFLLALSFVVTAIGESLFSISFWLQAFGAGISLQVSGSVYLAGMAILTLNTYFYYFFANRHILRDNDILKSLMGLFWILAVGLVFGLGIPELLQNPSESSFYYIYGYLPGADLTMYIIGYIFAAVFFPGAFLFVFGRIIRRGILIQRRSKDIIVKKGLMLTLTASIVHLVGAFFRTAIYWFKFVRETIPLAALIFAFGTICTALALTLYYLGWVMPDWLRRRFREQAWFTKIYIGKISEPEDILPKPVESSVVKTVEISEP